MNSEGEHYKRRFQAIFEQSSVPTQLYSSEGFILEVNSAWRAWTNLSEGDVKKLKDSGYSLLKDPALIKIGVVDNFRKALDGHAVQTPPVFYNLADYGLHKQRMWIQSNFYPIPDVYGKITEVLILHHDISELMQAKQEFESVLEQAKRIAFHAPVGIQIYDSSGYCFFVNEVFESIFGASPPPGYCVLKDELVAAAGSLHLIHQAFAGQPTQLPLLWYDPRELHDLSTEDLAHTRKTGKKCAIETSMIPVVSHEGKVTHVIFIYKDVTAELFMQEERQRAIKERDDAKAMIRSVLDETKAVIYIKDLAGKFVFVNGQFCRILNKNSEDILGKQDHELFPQEVADEFRRNDLHVLETREHLEIEEAATHADGSTHIYLSLKFPLNDSLGSLYGTCGISTDISQHKQLERELNAAKRMETVGLLAGGIAHDFNNTIEIIMLVADTLLLTGAGDKPEWRESIESMKSAAQNAALLTRQLLAFAKKQVFSTKVIDIGSTLKKTKEVLSKALPSDITISFTIDSDVWPVCADPLQIEQILTNLCFNARDAMAKGGNLGISVKNVELRQDTKRWRLGRPLGEYVELMVSDSGIGMDEKIIDRIFEPFFTTKKNGVSSGLGLSTVHGIVQSFEGDIEVESKLGKGTAFRIVLPKSKENPYEKPGSGDDFVTPIGGSETILLVEDQEPLRKVTAKLLIECGYKVIEAGSADEALNIWKSFADQIDLVLSDIVMPDRSGIDMIQQMSCSPTGRSLKYLLVSAYSEQKLSEYDFKKDMFHFIRKPYTANELLRKLREII